MPYEPVAYDPQNIFAKMLRGEIPCIKVYEDDAVLAFMDIFPASEGHALVIPKLHAANLLRIAAWRRAVSGWPQTSATVMSLITTGTRA